MDCRKRIVTYMGQTDPFLFLFATKSSVRQVERTEIHSLPGFCSMSRETKTYLELTLWCWQHTPRIPRETKQFCTSQRGAT